MTAIAADANRPAGTIAACPARLEPNVPRGFHAPHGDFNLDMVDVLLDLLLDYQSNVAGVSDIPSLLS
jgi:hypothetical protein